MTAPQIKELSEAEFASSEVTRRVITHDYPRRFAALSLPECGSSLLLSWRSDLIEPTIIVDYKETPVVWVGVDDRVATVRNDGQLLLSLALNSPLLTILLFSGGAVVICELQAVVINRDSTIRAIVDFPEIPESYKMSADRLSVVFMDGSTDEFAV